MNNLYKYHSETMIGHNQSWERSGNKMWIRVFLQLKQWITLEVIFSRDKNDDSKEKQQSELDS